MENKMFVHYSGTIAAFKAAGNETTYANSIVFISGDAEGKGAAIYTHNKYFGSISEALASLTYFSSISDGSTTATASGPNGTIIFSGDDNATVNVQAGSTGIKIGISDTVMNAIAAKAENSALTAVDNRLKTVEGDYLKAADKTELQGNIDAKVAQSDYDTKIAALEKADADNLAAAKTYAEGEADAAEAAAKTYADGLKSAIEGTFDEGDAQTLAAINDRIDTINATVEGQSYKIIAVDPTETNVLEEYKLQVGGNDIEGSSHIKIYKDSSLKSVALDGQTLNFTYILADGSESTVGVDVSAFLSEEEFINGLQVVDHKVSIKLAEGNESFLTVDANGLKLSGVQAAIEAAVAAEAALARAAEKANADAIDAIEADYLKAADKTELQGNIDAVSAVANAAAPQATTYTKTEVDGLVNGVDAKFANYYLKTETYSQAEVNAMWEWVEL